MKKKLSFTSALLCAALMLTGCSSDDETAPTETTEAVAPDLTSAPADAHWQPVSGITVPVKSADGPDSSDPVYHGYAHTPQGAVLAAINGQVAMAIADDTKWDEVSTTLLAPGQGRDQWAQGRALVSVAPGAVQTNPATFQGFKITEFSDDRTQVLLAADYPGVGLTVYPVQLIWQNDWKIVVPTLGAAPDLTRLGSLEGFTPFSADQA